MSYSPEALPHRRNQGHIVIPSPYRDTDKGGVQVPEI